VRVQQQWRVMGATENAIPCSRKDPEMRLRTTLINAVQAATERSCALGELAAAARRKAGA